MDALARTARAVGVATVALLTTAATAAAQQPAPAKLSVAVAAKRHVRATQLALRGERVLISGALTPFVAGERVTVRVRHGHKTVWKRTVAPVLDPQGRGAFIVAPRIRQPGRLTVQAVHAATPQLGKAVSKRARFVVARSRLSYGARGPLVRLFQRRLRAMGYEARVTGRYDDATGRAVMAWRKVNRRARVYSADSSVVRRVLEGRGGWKVRHPGAGHHVEADISLQALALIDGKRVQHIFPTSSGKPSTPTVLGTFRFYSKTPGYNAKAMLDSNYFIRGYAIHGYYDVPPYNASHGCLRIPLADAATAYNWIRLGDRIFVEP